MVHGKSQLNKIGVVFRRFSHILVENFALPKLRPIQKLRSNTMYDWVRGTQIKRYHMGVKFRTMSGLFFDVRSFFDFS